MWTNRIVVLQIVVTLMFERQFKPLFFNGKSYLDFPIKKKTLRT